MKDKTLAKQQDEALPGEATRLADETPISNNGTSESEVPMDDSVYTRRGMVFLFVTLISFGLWAAFVPLSSAVVAVGEIVVDTNRKVIQHYEGGIIREILVNNGERVSKGTPLIQLETTQWEAELRTTQDRVYGLQAELERLIAEQNFNQKLEFSPGLYAAAEENPAISRMLQQQKQLHQARLSAHSQHRQALESRIKQIGAQIVGLERQAEVIEEHIASLQEEREAHSALYEEGLGDAQRSRELNRSILQLRNELTRINSDAARLAIHSTEAELELAKHMQDFLREVGERIREQQTELLSAHESLRVTQDRVRRATITAPEPGVIVNRQVHTIGGVVAAGSPLLDLVPEDDPFVIEAQVRPQDVNSIYHGQLADIRFSAFSSQTTLVVEGEVIYLSADRLENERDGTHYYLARLAVTEKGQKNITEEMQLKAGMPAEVMIRGESRTMLSYLTRPITDSMARGMREE